MPVPVFTAGEILTASNMNLVGLWKIASGNLAGITTSGSDLSGIFSSSFRNYRLIVNVTAASTSTRLDMQFLVGTTPTGNYYHGGIGADYASNATVYFSRSNNDSELDMPDTASTARNLTMDIYNPNVAINTMFSGTYVDVGSIYHYNWGGLVTGTAQHTGIRFKSSAGTIGLTYAVYGYRA